ncbi:MAG: hypothetical protein ABJ246_03940 [Paracoccaceae bacterium]
MSAMHQLSELSQRYCEATGQAGWLAWWWRNVDRPASGPSLRAMSAGRENTLGFSVAEGSD